MQQQGHLGQTLERDRYQQISSFHAILFTVVEQTLGSGEPAAATARLASQHESVAQPERAPGGPHWIAHTQGLVMCTRPEIIALVIPAGQVRNSCEPLKILELEPRLSSR
ncbi:MAG: hypothetical protein M3526_03710 [Actinomycetota bacterium]|nr:hypothetical protein [Actinomycetota bacterium]